MKIYRFDADAGRPIAKFGSANFHLSSIARLRAEARISCAHLGANGVLGYHEAVTPQLFRVVQGEGWVRAEAAERVAIRAGDAAFWNEGDWHEVGTADGLMAVVIEGGALDPAEFMPLKEG